QIDSCRPVTPEVGLVERDNSVRCDLETAHCFVKVIQLVRVHVCCFRRATLLPIIAEPHVRSAYKPEGTLVRTAPKADVKIDVCILSALECDVVVSPRTLGSRMTGWRGVTQIVVFTLDGTSRAKYG